MTTKKRPPRASSPDSDFIERMASSSPEPPEDPLANVIIGSQSRAAKRGEYVPVPTRSYGVPASQSATRGSSRTTLPPLQRPVPRPKPVSKAKPPSRTQSRPPVSKGKGKAKEVLDVIEISDDSDGDRPTSPPAPRTFPLHPSRRGNVAPASRARSTLDATTTTSRKKHPTPSTSGHRDSAPQVEPSVDEGEDDAFITADEALGAGSGAGAAAKRRRVEKPVDRSGQVMDEVTGAGVPMDADIDSDVDMDVDADVDAGYQSDATLSYVSEEEPELVPRRQLEVVREDGSTPARAGTKDDHDGAQNDMAEDEKPFPDFASLCGSTSIVVSAPTPSPSRSSSKTASSSTPTAGGHVSQSRRAHENAVAGPSMSDSISASENSNSNAVAGPSNFNSSTSTSIFFSTSKPDTTLNSNTNTDLQLNTHVGLFDDSGMSAEDAAAVYTAMFGEEEDALPLPIPLGAAQKDLSSSVPGPSAPASLVPTAADANKGLVAETEGKGKGKARADPDPAVGPVAEPGREPEPAPLLKWGEWNPLCVLGHDGEGAEDSTGKGLSSDALKANEEKAMAIAMARAPEPATMEEHFLRALRPATVAAVPRDGDANGKMKGKGKAKSKEDERESEDKEEGVPAHVAYMRCAARAFEQAWGDAPMEGDSKGKGKAGNEKEAAVAGAQNAFTFAFPRGAGAPAVPPVGRQDEPPQQPQPQPPVAQPTRDPWEFMYAPPIPHERQPVSLRHAPLQVPPPVPAARPFPFAAPAVGVAGVVQPQHPAAAVAPVPPPATAPAPQPGAFTFAFPRGVAAPAAVHGPRAQAAVPGPAVVAAPRPVPVLAPHVPAQRPQPVAQSPPIAPPAAQQPLVLPREAPVPVQAPPVQVVMAPPVQVAAPAPQPAPVPAAAPVLTHEQLTERAIAQIKEILPDVEPGYLLAHVSTHVGAMRERTAEHVLGILFEAEAGGGGGYPRVVRERGVPPPAHPGPAQPQRAPVQPRAQDPQPQPAAGGSNLGVHVRAGDGQACGRQLGVEPLNKKAKIDEDVGYEDINRRPPSEAYGRLSLHYLRLAFPYLPKHIVATTLLQHNNFYAPTYNYLHAAERRYNAFPVLEERPYRSNSTKYNATPERRALARMWDELFGEEWLWVEERHGRVQEVYTPILYARMRAGHGAPPDAAAGQRPLGPIRVPAHAQVVVPPPPGLVPPVVDNGKGKQRAVDVEMAPPVEEQPEEEDGDIECQCCFSESTFDKMVQCPDTHLFCSDCVSQYAATQLGAHNPSLLCMHSSDCKLPFPESELHRVLAPTLMALYSRLTAQRAVAEAGLDGLEECPFCDWQCVIDAPIEMDRLFRCGNEEGGCGVVSCRECKKKDHLPKTCKEMEDDQVLDGQHAIEEAMTRALMRNCPNPKCKKAFVKETGCNKMTCPHCRTLSCYVCRQIINGYDHFDVMPGAAANTAVAGRCKLWENVEERHVNEVRAAAERAAEELRRANPEIDHEAIKVDIPVVPPPALAAAGDRAVPAPVVNPRQAPLQQQAAQLRLQQELQRQRVLEEARRQQELRAQAARQARERKAELRRQRKQRERDAQEQRRQEALRIQLQQQQELQHRAAAAAPYNAERPAALNPGPFGGLVRAPAPPMQPPGFYAPGFPHGADQNNRGQRKQ